MVDRRKTTDFENRGATLVHVSRGVAVDGPAWGERTLGGALQYAVFHGLIRAGGRPAAYGLLRLVVLWYVAFYPRVRRRTRPYLSRRFPDRTRAHQRFADTYRLCLAFGKVLVDRAVVALLGESSTRVEFPDGPALRALVLEGHGVVLVNSHVGCWQVAMSTLEALGKPVHLIMRTDGPDGAGAVATPPQGAGPIRTIRPDGFAGGTVEAAAALMDGEIVGVMGDRVFGDPDASVAVPFLGGGVRLPLGGWRLAAATSAPVALLFTHKTGRDSYALRLGAVLRPPRAAGRTPEGCLPWAAQYAAALEAYVREHPFQFFNFFDLWDESVPGSPGGAGHAGAKARSHSASP